MHIKVEYAYKKGDVSGTPTYRLYKNATSKDAMKLRKTGFEFLTHFVIRLVPEKETPVGDRMGPAIARQVKSRYFIKI